jgi:hypothetical protein
VLFGPVDTPPLGAGDRRFAFDTRYRRRERFVPNLILNLAARPRRLSS